jgi:hypothetical protein
LNRIIEASHSDLGESEWRERYSDLAPFRSINTLHWSDWDEIALELSDEDLVSLTKGMAMCEMQFRWGGGSVSAVIWLFRAIERRTLDTECLANWLLENSDNPYIPFGTNRGRAASISEMHERRAARELAKEQNLRADQDRKVAAEAARLQKSTAHLEQGNQLRAAWQETLAELEQCPLPLRLRIIVCKERDVAVSAYPEEWAALTTSEILLEFTTTELIALKVEVASVTRGEWKKLGRRIDLHLAERPDRGLS